MRFLICALLVALSASASNAGNREWTLERSVDEMTDERFLAICYFDDSKTNTCFYAVGGRK